MKRWHGAGTLALALSLAAGDPPRSGSEKEIEATIAANRAYGKPRSVAPRGGLAAWEEERARIFRESRNSVVHITSLSKERRNPYTRNEMLVPQNSGSGFIWNDVGHVVTNCHVVTGAEALEVKLADGKSYQARVIGQSAAYDVAVLHVFAPLADLKPLPLGSSEDLVVGQSTLAIGNPFGLDHTLTTGIVSALDREIQTFVDTTIRGVIQTDAAINPGNSGGPLLDSAGRLIGMNTAIPNATGASVGIGFAIPAHTLNRVVPLLISKGALEIPYYGFEILPSQEAYRRTGLVRGVIVAAVDKGSPAAKAGLAPWTFGPQGQVVTEGDIIIGCSGQPVEEDYQLGFKLEQSTSDKPITFDVVRGGKRIQITVTPTERKRPRTAV